MSFAKEHPWMTFFLVIIAIDGLVAIAYYIAKASAEKSEPEAKAQDNAINALG